MIFSDEETNALDRIAIEEALADLPPVERTMIELHYGYAVPELNAGPGLVKVGRYLPRLHRHHALSATRVYFRIQRVLARWYTTFQRRER